jgi:hypothetical protein
MAPKSSLAERPRMPKGTPAQRKRKATKISEIPVTQRACRAGRHPWPSDELETGKVLPKGLSAFSTETSGVYQLIDQCQRCGKVRWKLTLPNHIYDPGATWRYIDPRNQPGYEDWVTLDESLEVTKGDLKAYAIAEHAEALFS